VSSSDLISMEVINEYALLSGFYIYLKAVAFPIDLNNLVLTEPEAVGMLSSGLL